MQQLIQKMSYATTYSKNVICNTRPAACANAIDHLK